VPQFPHSQHRGFPCGSMGMGQRGQILPPAPAGSPGWGTQSPSFTPKPPELWVTGSSGRAAPALLPREGARSCWGRSSNGPSAGSRQEDVCRRGHMAPATYLPTRASQARRQTRCQLGKHSPSVGMPQRPPRGETREAIIKEKKGKKKAKKRKKKKQKRGKKKGKKGGGRQTEKGKKKSNCQAIPLKRYFFPSLAAKRLGETPGANALFSVLPTKKKSPKEPPEVGIQSPLVARRLRPPTPRRQLGARAGRPPHNGRCCCRSRELAGFQGRAEHVPAAEGCRCRR